MKLIEKLDGKMINVKYLFYNEYNEAGVKFIA